MKKIVLIDDDKGIRETTQEILELAGYKVFTSENGKKGIHQIKDVIPDIILCDIAMPELNGYETLRILNRMPQTAKIPFIFLSSHSDNKDIRKGMNLGADDYLTKPFKEIDLLDAIEIRISRSEKMNRIFNSDINGVNEFIESAHELSPLENIYKKNNRKKYDKNEIIFKENDNVNFIYYIISGRVKRIETDSHGKEFLDDIHTEGEFFGYLNLFHNINAQHRRTAIVLEPTEIALIPKEDFNTLIKQNRDVSISFIKLLSGNVLDKEERLLKIAYASVRERVASILLKHTTDDKLKLQISRDDLANLVGTSKESLIRTLTDFKKENVIITGRADITVIKIDKLKRISEGF
ncbi:MAG: response regulator [Flavobacteriaceae bacterium]